MNSVLPPDIVVKEMEEVAGEFTPSMMLRAKFMYIKYAISV